MKTFNRGQRVIIRTMSYDIEQDFIEEFISNEDLDESIQGIWIQAYYVEQVNNKHRVLVVSNNYENSYSIDLEIHDNRIFAYNDLTFNLINSNTSESYVQQCIDELIR